MIENQCPLRLTCNRPRDLSYRDFNFRFAAKNTRFKTFNFKEFIQTKKLMSKHLFKTSITFAIRMIFGETLAHYFF